MQENKFENKVQQQMEEFRIRPSEAVWEKVEEALRKKKKRRVVFFIFLLAGLSLLGYSGYFLLNNSKQNLVQQNITLPGNDKSIKDNELLPGKENSSDKVSQFEKENDLSLEKEKSIATEEKIIFQESDDIFLNDKETVKEKNLVLKSEGRKAIKKTRNKTLPVEIISRDNTNDVSVANKNSLQAREKSAQPKRNSVTPVKDKEDISQPFVAENNLQKEESIPVTKENIQTKKDSIADEVAANNEVLPAITKKKKWTSKINWGIDLSAGISNNREDLLSFSDRHESITADFLSSPTNNFSNASPGIVYSPSTIQSGPAFRAGLVAELKISPKSSISSGLRYAYFSNTMKVGTRNTTTLVLNSTASRNTAINSFYRGFPQKDYTNRYHFIQLPVQYQLQLNKGVKLPLSWNIGASAGYLFATNGLVYDAMAGGVYYRNNDAFNKIQFNLNTGVSFRFGNKNKIQWSLGPELSLGMNKLVKDDYAKKQYLLYGGMTGRINFVKKNK